MPPIFVTVEDNGTDISVTVNPREVTAHPASRDLFWILNSGTTGWTWSQPNGGSTPAGIVLANDPPSPYSPWTGDPAQPGENGSYVALAPPPPNDKTLRYKYMINLVNTDARTIRFDPDIANDPHP